MKFLVAFFAVVISGAASTAALAASTDHPKDQNHPTSREGWSDRCAGLDAQFDSLTEQYTNNPEYEAARGLHTEGVSACMSNNGDAGVVKLEAALRKLGVEPTN